MLLGDLVLEALLALLGLLTSLALGILGVDVGPVRLGLALLAGTLGVRLGGAQDLVLLLRERCVGVARGVEVVGLGPGVVLCLRLGLLLHVLRLLLALLSLVVGLTGGAGVAVGIADPVRSVTVL